MNHPYTADCLCDCCTGTRARTPVPVANAPGLDSLVYRVGRHGDFFTSMLARLASMRADPGANPASGGGHGAILRGQSVPPGIPPEYPLTALTVRTTDDPAVALLDAWAVVLDVLTFYQERVANEGFLRTATEYRSVRELARLVGYSPRPGVGASAYLAYGVEKDTTLTLAKGSRSTSTPGPGESPQTFETSTDLNARGRWTALVARKGRPQVFEPGQTSLRGSSVALACSGRAHHGGSPGRPPNLGVGRPALTV